MHTVLAGNSVAFTSSPGIARHDQAVWWAHFDCVCHEHAIKHRLTKVYHPWINGQVERMNRTIKDATIKAHHYPDFAALKTQILAFVMAYNFARHLESLRWRTPFNLVFEAWTKNPERFSINPHQLIPGPHT
ncbi:integrase core domain-containing protein [Pseudomonas sp. PONIH3]|uniref:integrase core domain-containing protein n=1 Tax=Pseudomonas sp. PONIH3 TaxID=1636610 RepID=UPI003D2CD7C5